MTLPLPQFLRRWLGWNRPARALGPRTYGQPVCWGPHERWQSLPIANLPADTIRVRRRFRANDVARVTVRTRRGVSAGYLAPAEANGEEVTHLRVIWTAHNLTDA